MLNPMIRMCGYGICMGVGLCNILWMMVDFSTINNVIAVASLGGLFALYLDYRRSKIWPTIGNSLGLRLSLVPFIQGRT